MGRKPSYAEHGAFRIPMGFPAGALASGLEYRARPDDIFVSSYPKCGTTWIQHVVYLIQNDAVPLSPGQKLTERFPHLEEVGKDFVDALPPPRLIKIHLPFAMTPYHRQARYIYVARNPFDCAVSFYHHTRGFPQHYDFADGTFEDFFECFINGEVDFGDYFDNLLSWYPHRDDPNVLFLTYEAMTSDARAGIFRIGDFLGVDALRNEGVIEAVLQHSSFSSMSEHQERWSSARPTDMPAFIRKGRVGDWPSLFSPEQTRRLLDKFERWARGSDLETLWPDILGSARAHC